MKPLDTLRQLGPGSEPPEKAKQRVFQSLLAALEIAAAATAAAPAAATPKPPATTPSALLLGGASPKALLVAAGLWLAGVATGGALVFALRAPTKSVVYVDRPPVATVAPVSPLEAAPPPIRLVASASALQGTVRPQGTATPSRPNPTLPSSELAAERALLDRARSSGASGDPARVLELVAQHRREFPGGRLAEEREALAIRALCSLGRGDEARARAGAFRVAFPHSFLAPVIDSALAAL